jgi:hypothetical protein
MRYSYLLNKNGFLRRAARRVSLEVIYKSSLTFNKKTLLLWRKALVKVIFISKLNHTKTFPMLYWPGGNRNDGVNFINHVIVTFVK